MIPVDTNVYCATVDETRQAILIYLNYGIRYWPTDTWDSDEQYLTRFEEYPYIQYRDGEIAGNYSKLTGVNYLTFQEFSKKYAPSKKLKLLNMIKDFQ